MCKNKISTLLDEVVSEVTPIFNDKLESIILYGSYARGDQDDESDIDIALLVDLERIHLREYDKKIVTLMSELSLKYGILVSFASIPIREFNEYKDILPYYRNIDQEGVNLSA